MDYRIRISDQASGVAPATSFDRLNTRQMIRARLEKLNSIPTIPAIVRPLLHYMEKPVDQLEVKRIVDMVSCDESIAAQCLRMANSALYFLPQSVKTVHGAVIVLGIRQVREILMASSLFNLLPKEQTLLPTQALWEHSLGCALLSREMARQIGYADPERAYLGGLLHDLGELINYVVFPSEARACLASASAEHAPLHEVEIASFGFSHCDRGSVVAEMWRLPFHLSEVIRFHHSVQQTKLYPDLVALVSLCDVFCRAHELGYGYSENELPDPARAIEWSILSEKTAKVGRVGPKILVREMEVQVQKVRKHVQSVFAS